MAKRNILMVGDELLRKKSKPVSKFDENLWELLDDMRETMEIYDGMGLAAPQVGILKRIFICEVNSAYFEFINPEITKTSGEEIEKEGCLSVCLAQEYVKRPSKVTVKAQDRNGNNFTLTGEKYLARCICHENDHLDGILYIDKIEKSYKGKGK